MSASNSPPINIRNISWMAANHYRKNISAATLKGLNKKTNKNYFLKVIKNITKRNSGRTPLMYAVIKGDLKKVKKYLEDFGNDRELLNQQDKRGMFGIPYTALDYAFENVVLPPYKSKNKQEVEHRNEIFLLLLNHENVEISYHFIESLRRVNLDDPDIFPNLGAFFEFLIFKLEETKKKNNILFKEIENHGGMGLLLPWVIKYQDAPLIQRLIEYDKVNVNVEHGEPLAKALETGNLELIDYLVEHKANVHARDGDFDPNFLEIAVKARQFDSLKYLIEEAKLQDPLQINNAFLEASRLGYLEMMDYLLNNGAIIDTDNNLALREAIYHPNLEVIQFLVDNGLDIHFENDYAIRLAVKLHRQEVIDFLMNLGADKSALLEALEKRSKKEREIKEKITPPEGYSSNVSFGYGTNSSSNSSNF